MLSLINKFNCKKIPIAGYQDHNKCEILKCLKNILFQDKLKLILLNICCLKKGINWDS